ncbi:MAG: adenosylcobinamide-GDP ribazoletransferase [Chloroflexi bacterium]|nr:adenosylcobinamide-GDP ribazoletransferase [Chloroflexota bacterium]
MQFLTRIPVPPGEHKLEDAFIWFAPVGLLIGALLALVDYLARSIALSSSVTAALIVTTWLLVTGALHADGLMDTCDAVFAHASAERRLEIMRDPRAGAFGVVGIVCVVLLKFAALDALPVAVRLQTLILAPGLGRWAIAFVSALFPYARETGLGAPLKKAATPRALLVASIAPLVACGVVWPLGLPLAALALLTAWLVSRGLLMALPGLTGDCYGAVCELVEAVVLVGAAPVAHALS